MNSQNSNIAGNTNECCVDYCKATFKAQDKEIVNTYKCNQTPFTAAEAWKIQRNRSTMQ